MLARVMTVANVGLKSILVEVEVDVASAGFPAFEIVGLPDKAVNESKERVKAAIVNSGMEFPMRRITVNMAPADVKKEGAAYDLPIAVGILVAGGLVEADLTNKIFYGELGLDGGLRHTSGCLLVAMLARDRGIKEIYLPIESAGQATVIDGVSVLPVRNVTQWIEHSRGEKLVSPLKQTKIDKLLEWQTGEFDLADILGQEMGKRALTIAAAGGHNLLMVGPPGSGKTMLARALPGILPPLTNRESLEITRIYSVAGLMQPGEAIVRKRPFRAPHHSISTAGLIGGGTRLMPGEAVLAHLGVLFLDEVAEFPRSALEALRQPMEDGTIEIARVAGQVEYPARFQVIAAANPCPCGYYGHPTKVCHCGEGQIDRYARKISGPIIDRIDLCINVPVVETNKLVGKDDGGNIAENNPKSVEVRKMVVEARNRQSKRFRGTGIYCNAQMKNKQVSKYCVLNGETKRLLMMAMEKYDLSARGYFRILKVARTIADLAGVEEVQLEHVAEALQYREKVFG